MSGAVGGREEFSELSRLRCGGLNNWERSRSGLSNLGRLGSGRERVTEIDFQGLLTNALFYHVSVAPEEQCPAVFVAQDVGDRPHIRPSVQPHRCA